MFAFFDGLVNFISTVINFVINFFTSLVHLFIMVGQSMVYIIDCVNYLPVFLKVFILALVGLAVIFQVINHGG
ncbi:MAG: hypothetical protein [Inoviridae sp.]|nr:MAG: hypothetical protein [Inoviridae sp.]